MNLDLSCPHCGHADWVQSVPAAMSEGTDSGYSTGVHTGFAIAPSGLVPVIGATTREFGHSSALARSLTWQPVLPSAGPLSVFGSVLLLFVMLVYALASAAVVEGGLPRDPIRMMASLLGYYIFPIMLSVPVLAILSVAFQRARRNGKVQSGRGRARQVWSHGYYCHRCGVAFWPYPTAPGVPCRVALSPAQFRWHVWNSGGYAKL